MTSENLSDPELEKILMKMGLLTQPQLTEALEFQARIPHSQWMPIGEVLLEMERITPEQLQQAKLAIQATTRQVTYEAPDWDEVFDPLVNPKTKQAPPPARPKPDSAEPETQWDAIFDKPDEAQAQSAKTQANELDLKYLFEQGKSQASLPPEIDKQPAPPTPDNISRDPLPDLEALFNMGAPSKSVKPATSLASIDSTDSKLDLSILFDSPPTAQPAPKNQSTPAADLFNFPLNPATSSTSPSQSNTQSKPPELSSTPPANPVTRVDQQARPAAPAPAQVPAPPAPVPVAQQDGWTVQSAWGVPKQPFVSPPTPEPEFRKPVPPPAPPAATHQLRQQELEQMITKVMGPDAQGSQQPDKPLGEILLEEKELEEWQLTHALCMQESDIYSKQKIGAILIKMGYVTQEEIERALKTQIKP